MDFELMWGVRDKKSIASYGENILGVYEVIPALLELFQKYDVHGTFSTVGFLFFQNKKELFENLPDLKPNYTDKNLSPYNGYFKQLSNSNSRYHFALDLIKLILKSPNQELGTHTFSHYYCLEKGQTVEEFHCDIKQAIKIGKAHGVELKSLVFPRNQTNKEYLDICKRHGIICYRGKEKSFSDISGNSLIKKQLKRGLRLIDTYLNISGYNCYSNEEILEDGIINIPASKFLRPYSHKSKIFDNLKLRRIKRAMTHAAKNGKTFHLWWHPHNFGSHITENINFLERIMQHYQNLNLRYDFKSLTMSQLAHELILEKNEC